MGHSDVFGRMGEQQAAAHLVGKGYTIRCRNFRFRQWEIDLVAQQGDTLVIVEVKTRKSHYLAQAQHTVPLKKQRGLITAAQAYIERYHIELETRFDIVAILLNERERHIDHIEGAFYPLL